MSDLHTKQAVFFYNDRNKDDVDYRLNRIIFEGEGVCLCEAVPIVRPKSHLAEQIALYKAQPKDTAANDAVIPWWKRISREMILFSGVTGEVLSKNLDSWYATNDRTVGGYYENNAHEVPELNRPGFD